MSFTTTNSKLESEPSSQTEKSSFINKKEAMSGDDCTASSSSNADLTFIRLQAYAKGRCYRNKFTKLFRQKFIKLLDDADENELKSRKNIRRNTDLLKYGLVLVAKSKTSCAFNQEDTELLMILCQALCKSMTSPSNTESFAALFLSVNYLHRANRLVTELCRKLPSTLAHANLSKVLDVRLVNSAALFLHTFHSAQAAKWTLVKDNCAIVAILNNLCVKMSAPLAKEKSLILLAELLSNGLKGSKTILSFNVVNMVFSVILRAIKNHLQDSEDCEERLTKIVVLKFLTSPAIILSLSNVTLNEIKLDKLLNFQKVILWLAHNRSLVSRLSTVENLNLLANFIHLSYFEQEVLIENLLDWTLVVNSFLTKCIQQLSPPNNCSFKGISKNNNWHHPILGWISERIDEGTQGTFGRIRLQLGYLWSQRIVDCLFGKVLASFQNSAKLVKRKETVQEGESLPVDLMQKLLKRLSLRDQTDHQQLSKPLPPVSVTAVVCQLYQNALLTFSNTQIEILSGLCRNDAILLQLWNYVNEDANEGLSNYLSFLHVDPTVSLPHFAPLHLFADTAYSLISILDEKEMYESDAPFKLDQLRQIAKFANTFCFKVIWENLIDLNERRPNALFQSIYQLCTILYNRDCRRSFTSNIPNFWTISDVKPSLFTEETEKKTSRARLLISKMPHVVPLRDRIVLFRKSITPDKSADHSTTVITVERSRIVEDGYRQLSSLPSQALRGTIRVKFINQQGLDEAGIDQDGVFKEFLELTLKKVFDPELNLFKSTSNSLLYPSSTSSIHENHLGLFQFVGRMLAKAVYEGICVDIQLAPVLLATVLSKQLCPFDELATLDPVLYKNLTYVKHYSDSEDVADLELTFAYNEEFLGKVRTTELIFGGQELKVANENKIMYIHKMAQFRVIRHTKEQCENFVAGFRSIIGLKSLSFFNTHELQYLISGHTSDIDLEDLRKHSQYYGGFHSNHRLIKWLWCILQNDFSADERHLFLKFVTSCSRAPLLGFAFLEPPFSIRCVETSDDMDQGDTLGSVIRGFLAIKRKQPMNRLPTASTCFNLLKLPNYNKKTLLLEKLRYAIHAETGFELS